MIAMTTNSSTQVNPRFLGSSGDGAGSKGLVLISDLLRDLRLDSTYDITRMDGLFFCPSIFVRVT